MIAPRWLVVSALFAASIAVPTRAAGEVSRDEIAIRDTAPEGLAGDGRVVARVRPGGFAWHTGGTGASTFTLAIGDSVFRLDSLRFGATFFPGGVCYRARAAGADVEVLHGSLPEASYLVALRVRGARGPVAFTTIGDANPALQSSARAPISADPDGVVRALFATTAWAGPPDIDGLRARIAAPYRTGLVLRTPDALLDRAVPFSRALLDVGFDGRMHVCEIFRWRDVWSRDLGSGLAVGAMASGRFDEAFSTIAYDLARHERADPLGLKVTQDPSQGGTAEGVAWLSRAAWREYLLTGERAFLRRTESALRPWTEAWLARDADGRGTLIDVSEWMDHSRFFLFPDGARTLYSNVLFAEHLARFARIERALGADSLARRYDEAAQRFVAGVNATLWNEALGQYDNLELWGRRDERTTSAENALAVLAGVASESRARRALARVREGNWRPAGSTTIYPPMTHVPEYIDHNFKVWPWWEAVEARARFRLGDDAAAIELLDHAAATLDDPHFPGMMEELTSPEGRTEGGFAFLTAAGSYLDAIVGGLLGFEVIEPGCARLRVEPHAPATWRDWSATVPLPRGEVRLACENGALTVTVTDARVREIEVPAGTRVIGAAAVALSPQPMPGEAPRPTARPPVPAPRPRRAVVFAPGGDFPSATRALDGPRVDEEGLLQLDPRREGALIVSGNALPRRTASGGDVPAALAHYLDAGGALVFASATMRDRGTMGEHSGVIEWYERRPVVTRTPLAGWTFRRSFSEARTPRERERGLVAGWQARVAPTDSAWSAIAAGKPWEEALGYDYDGWGWYRAHFTLPASARGRVVVIDLGRVDDDDWTFVNGVLAGAQADWQSIRHYRLQPGDSAYGALVFGGDNTLSVQVRDSGGGGGLFVDTPWFGVETDRVAWTPIDPRSGEVAPAPVRHGVVSWGPGGRFFHSWETSRGAFGFALEGRGARYTGPLEGLPAIAADVREGFTDFATSSPWRFEPLAFTHTSRRLLVPDEGEDYPCAARLVNTGTGGEIVLIGASLAHAGAVPSILERLRIDTVDRATRKGDRR